MVFRNELNAFTYGFMSLDIHYFFDDVFDVKFIEVYSKFARLNLGVVKKVLY